MSQTIALSKCLIHTAREAVARCPQCRQFFCRECITEHGGRVLCAPCLAKQARTANETGKLAWIRLPVAAAAAFLLLWMVLFQAARFISTSGAD